jgi:NTE family protein
MDSSPSSTAFVLSGGGVAAVRELAEIWIGLRRGTVFPLNPLTGLFGFAGRRGYMVPDSGLRA